jgi:hypothetical protein
MFHSVDFSVILHTFVELSCIKDRHEQLVQDIVNIQNWI